MKMDTAIIAVKRIQSDVPRSKFPAEELERLALTILKLDGLINPPVVVETGHRAYQVIDGHFAYHAAVRAKELNPRKGEMIAVYIVEPEMAEIMEEQISLLRKSDWLKTVRGSESLSEIISGYQKAGLMD